MECVCRWRSRHITTPLRRVAQVVVITTTLGIVKYTTAALAHSCTRTPATTPAGGSSEVSALLRGHGGPPQPLPIVRFGIVCWCTTPPLPQPTVLQKWFVQFDCGKGEFNSMASLLLSPSEVGGGIGGSVCWVSVAA